MSDGGANDAGHAEHDPSVEEMRVALAAMLRDDEPATGPPRRSQAMLSARPDQRSESASTERESSRQLLEAVEMLQDEVARLRADREDLVAQIDSLREAVALSSTGDPENSPESDQPDEPKKRRWTWQT